MAKKKVTPVVPDRFSTENEYWKTLAGSDILEVVIEETGYENYSVNRKHLYKLADKRFAVVRESGCSCYSMADADVETYDTRKEARAAYDEIVVEI